MYKVRYDQDEEIREEYKENKLVHEQHIDEDGKLIREYWFDDAGNIIREVNENMELLHDYKDGKLYKTSRLEHGRLVVTFTYENNTINTHINRDVS